MSYEEQYGYDCRSDCRQCLVEFLGCNIQVEADKYQTVNYCLFRKCHYGEDRYDLGACGIASSGETCWSLYPDVEDNPSTRFAAYDIHLEEVKLNDEQRKRENARDDLRHIC